MLADVSTPNGQTLPQGPNSPSGECSINRNTFGVVCQEHLQYALTQFSFKQIYCPNSINSDHCTFLILYSILLSTLNETQVFHNESLPGNEWLMYFS